MAANYDGTHSKAPDDEQHIYSTNNQPRPYSHSPGAMPYFPQMNDPVFHSPGSFHGSPGPESPIGTYFSPAFYGPMHTHPYPFQIVPTSPMHSPNAIPMFNYSNPYAHSYPRGIPPHMVYMYPGPSPAPPPPLSRTPTSQSSSSLTALKVETTTDVAKKPSPSMRQSYHPDPPAQRSPWAMWVGNVPKDATQDELWRFFTRVPDEQQGPDESSAVESIFIISRSNCAFVNYVSEAGLATAILRFDGSALRRDGRLPKLVCRIRKQTDDLRAGVGGQRGMGLHRQWVRDSEKRSEPQLERPELATTNGGKPNSSDSFGSNASTSSSFLTTHFPRRFFIMKSLTQDDVDLSTRTGIWATQKHNEGILDQAFRTSNEVYLFFSVNKSGEFYGYGRMTSKPGSAREPVSWSPRERPSPSSPIQAMLGADRLVDKSPSPGCESRSPPLGHPHYQSAPAQLAGGATNASRNQTDPKFSLDQLMAHSQPQPVANDPEPEGWGKGFELDWICTHPLPFHRTRHLRNPWNNNREIKVSRDGTELEPTVGVALLQAWRNMLGEAGGSLPTPVSLRAPSPS
ncbi:unnamed protein product [Mycena citricolor]|uniref:YTH domain-containing protein n=1 Tax=Mycena citricolor TaxID=2018698 RepID=A0AAD2K308_9AGAR|nr:unnamed protein product [Mycena citricolor]